MEQINNNFKKPAAKKEKGKAKKVCKKCSKRWKLIANSAEDENKHVIH